MIQKEVAFKNGIAILGDSSSDEVVERISEITGPLPLIVTDPPYGGVVSAAWDKLSSAQQHAEWMLAWTAKYSALLMEGSPFYVWGGIGTRGVRPFLRYLDLVEEQTELTLHNLITWRKKRAYGVQHNYLFTREELAFFVKGNPKKPRLFNVPLLEKERGYEGYTVRGKKHKAKSAFLRRTNVWDDVTEIFRGKTHEAQKPLRLFEIPIEVHTAPNEYVVDLFAGSGACAKAAMNLNRKFVVIEKDPAIFEKMTEGLALHESRMKTVS